MKTLFAIDGEPIIVQAEHTPNAHAPPRVVRVRYEVKEAYLEVSFESIVEGKNVEGIAIPRDYVGMEKALKNLHNTIDGLRRHLGR